MKRTHEFPKNIPSRSEGILSQTKGDSWRAIENEKSVFSRRDAIRILSGALLVCICEAHAQTTDTQEPRGILQGISDQDRKQGIQWKLAYEELYETGVQLKIIKDTRTKSIKEEGLEYTESAFESLLVATAQRFVKPFFEKEFAKYGFKYGNADIMKMVEALEAKNGTSKIENISEFTKSQQDTRWNPEETAKDKKSDQTSLGLTMAASVTLAPFFEELIFRGFPQLFLKDRAAGNDLRMDVGIPVAALFALAHNTYQDQKRRLHFAKDYIPLPQFICGVFYWYLMREKGLTHAMFGHLLSNSISLMVAEMLYSKFSARDKKISSSPERSMKSDDTTKIANHDFQNKYQSKKKT